MKIENILAILDKPKDAPIAFTAARALQARTNARLTCAAFTWQALDEVQDVFSEQQRADMRRTLLGKRAQQAQELLDSESGADAVPDAAQPQSAGRHPNVRLQTVWSKRIAEWVVEDYKTHPVDLIIKTAHPSHTLIHTPLDWALARVSPAPVLLVRDAMEQKSGNVIATLDLGHQDKTHRQLNQNVLATAHAMACLHNANLHVISVIEMSRVIHDLDVINEREYSARVKERTLVQLQSLLAPYDIPTERVHQPLGKLSTTIHGLADRLQADLLVVGNAPHPVKRAVGLASSAEKILAHAPCAVMSVCL